jgi:ATP-dependent exoDNAse (exonuclease V) beta subunit
VGLPDAALLPLWARGFPGQMSELEHPDAARLARLEKDLAEVATLLPASIPGIEGIRGWELSVMQALSSLAELRAAFQADGPEDSLSIDAWIDQLRANFAPDAVEAARYLGAYRLANLERFFDDLLANFLESNGDKQALLRALRSNIVRNERVDARPPGEGDSDTVKILTIHGSKGLEYSNVYLPQLHKKDEGGGNPFSTTAFDRRAGLVSYELFRSSTPNRAQTEALRQRTERAERVRLLYVALTRAENRLVLLNAWSPSDQATSWEQAKSYAGLLSQREHTAAPLEALKLLAPASSPEIYIDQNGCAWRLAAPMAQGQFQAPQSDPILLPSLTLTTAKLERLAEQRAQAKPHATRPYSGTASGHATSKASHSADANQGLTRESAARVGTAIHEALERFRADTDLGSLQASEQERLPAGFTELEREEFGVILEAMLQNGLLKNLAALEPNIIARELPILLPPPESSTGPTAFIAGAIDLVYKDSSSDELVVVDYKSEQIPSDSSAKQQARAHQAQGQIYTEALRTALNLEASPRFEIWFLRTGEITRLG